jgi:hypothetical protein
MIIVDTNVITEFLKPRPSPSVARWMRYAGDDLYTTAPNEAEARYGIERMTDGQRKRQMEGFIDQIFTARFRDCVLPFDSQAAKVLAFFLAQETRSGRNYGAFDAQIIAIAKVHGATIATGDTDFDHSGVPLINPWTA